MKKSNLYLVAPNHAESGALETLPKTDGLRILKNDELRMSKIRFSSFDQVCITSEASIELVKQRMDDDSKTNALNILKDKYKFRETLKNINPSYRFQKLKFDDIISLNINSKSVLKPAKGCFGTAVKTLTSKSNLIKIANEIKFEIDKNSSVLSSQV